MSHSCDESHLMGPEKDFVVSNFRQCVDDLQSRSATSQVKNNLSIAACGESADTGEVLSSLERHLGVSSDTDFGSCDFSNDTFVSLFNLAALYSAKGDFRNCMIILLYLTTKEACLEIGFAHKVATLLSEVVIQSMNTYGSGKEYDYKCSELFNYSSAALELLKTIQGNEEFNWIRCALSVESSEASSMKECIKKIASFHLHLSTSRHMIACGDLKAAKKEIKTSLDILHRGISVYSEICVFQSLHCYHSLLPWLSYYSDSLDCSTQLLLTRQSQVALFLKANIEYLTKNYIKSVKILASCRKAEIPTNREIDTLFYNNMGCLFFMLNRSGIALELFKMASHHMRSENKASIHSTIPAEYTTHVLYNTGVTLLFLEQPLDAFRCLFKLMSNLKSCPKYWVRLAECCIQRDILFRKTAHANQNSPISSVAIKGKFKKVILSNSESQLLEHSGGDCSLANAANYLTRAINLLELEKKKAPDSTATCNSRTAIVMKVKLSLAYVLLCCRDWIRAHQLAKEVIESSHVDAYCSFLARNYAAEALCELGRISEAAEMLDVQLLTPDVVENIQWDVPSYCGINGDRPFSKSDMAEATVVTNRAVVLMLLGRLQDSENVLRGLIDRFPSFFLATKCLAYILIRRNCSDDALKILSRINFTR